MDIDTKFVNKLLEYKGTPFKYFGRSKDGLDCVGLFIVARNEIGLPFYDFKDYSVFPRNNMMEEEMLNFSYKVDKIEKGSIILISYKKGQKPQHSIVYIGNNEVISANKKNMEVSIESLNEYKNNIHSIYKLKEG